MTRFRPRFRRPRFLSRIYREAGGHSGLSCVRCGGPGVVGAHLPHNAYGFPAGIGQKTHDWLLADLCAPCHFEFDEGALRNDIAERARVVFLTIQRRFDQGVLVIRGESHEAEEFLE